MNPQKRKVKKSFKPATTIVVKKLERYLASSHSEFLWRKDLTPDLNFDSLREFYDFVHKRYALQLKFISKRNGYPIFKNYLQKNNELNAFVRTFIHKDKHSAKP